MCRAEEELFASNLGISARGRGYDGDQTLWNVFDPEGRWLGTVETPYGGYIYQIGEDFLLGLWVDELDVEQVRVYPIDRSPGM